MTITFLPFFNLLTKPTIPNGCQMDKHFYTGHFTKEVKKIQLFEPTNRVTLNKQDDNASMRITVSMLAKTGVDGFGVIKELEQLRRRTANANVLDYLFKNQYLIPEDWKVDENGITRHVHFLGTLYKRWYYPYNLCDRFLHWNTNHWEWKTKNLEDKWDTGEVAAALAFG